MPTSRRLSFDEKLQGIIPFVHLVSEGNNLFQAPSRGKNSYAKSLLIVVGHRIHFFLDCVVRPFIFIAIFFFFFLLFLLFFFCLLFPIGGGLGLRIFCLSGAIDPAQQRLVVV